MASATGSTPALPPDPLSLKRRLTLQGGGFALLLLVAFSGTLYWAIALQRREDQRSELRQLAAAAAAQLALVAHETREPAGRTKFRPIQGAIAIAALEQQRVQWLDADGRLLSQQGSLPVTALPAVLPQTPEQLSWQEWDGGLSLVQLVQARGLPPASDPGGELVQAAATPMPPPGGTASIPGAPVSSSQARLGYVRVALSDAPARADLERLRRGLLVGGIVTALAALLVARRMLRAAFLPLQQQIDALQSFTADASHELRHPLTALRSVLALVPEELRREPDLAWPQLERLSRRMGELLEELLTLARLQQGGDDAEDRIRNWQRFDLMELLEDLLRCYTAQAATRSVNLRLCPKPEEHTVPVHGNSEELLRLFTNLLLNAMRHSPEGGLISLTVRPLRRRIQITICDQGPGIPTSHRDRVFDRFWSGADRGGTSGLGLAISRAIARRHGGELSLGESRTGLCELVVELPAAGDAA